MASYNNSYNRAIANRQKTLDVANLKNDYQNSILYPLHGGQMEGGDFWSDFADGFMSVWNPIIDTAGKVAPLLPLVGLGESGGDMSVNAPYEGYVYGSGLSGGAIANDGMPPFNEPTDAGMSGGKRAKINERALNKLFEYVRDNEVPDQLVRIIERIGKEEERGVPQRKKKYKMKKGDWCCITNKNKDFGCNGQPLGKSYMNTYIRRSKKFSGNGLSGGDEIADTDHPLLNNPELQATMFLGGRKPSTVSKAEKKRMVQQVIADMLLQKQLKNVHGKGFSGGDFWSDLGDTFSKVAPFLPLLGLGYSGGGLSGGGLSGGKTAFNKKYADMLLKEQLQNLHGAGLSGGDFDWSSLLSFAPLLLGLGMSGGEDPYDDITEFQPLIQGLGYSGGDFWSDLSKGFSDAWNWITDTAVPWVGDNLDSIGKVVDIGTKIAKAGAGQSGGAMTYEQNMNMADAMGDIFSGMGQSGGGQSGGSWAIARLLAPELSIPYDLATGKNPLTGETWGSGRKASDTLTKSGNIQLYKGGSSEELRLQQKRSNVNQPYLTGKGTSGGKKNNIAMKIKKLQGKGLEPVGDMEASNKIVGVLSKNNPEVDRKVGEGASGGARKPNKWIEHVKQFAKTHGISYGEAIKKAKATYRG
jgi:hypothetical protein